MNQTGIQNLISQMTLQEKAGLCSGADFWHLKGVKRLSIPSIMVADGPHGLRKQAEDGDHLGLGGSIPAVCFPAGCAAAASFDRDLIRLMGETIGRECQAEGISIILGPAVNIKRSPLCGRNFEYYSEDPLLASELAGALIEGVQSQNVGTSIKHFLANNQEYRRNTVSAEVDERTLREIYLAAFESAVRQHEPWTIMSSYNRLNGVYVGEDKKYLTDILRNEWGFKGFVMSDWGAVNDRTASLEAGLDLEMPSSNGENDALLVKAVNDGLLDEKVLDQACARILDVVYRFTENRDTTAIFDRAADHEISRKIASECVALLKNDDHILPIEESKPVALIGAFAETPRYQGGGSSHINSSQVASALAASGNLPNVTFSPGFSLQSNETDPTLLADAIGAAQKAQIAVIFAGLPDNFESEGYDRSHMRLPDCQNELISAVCTVQPNTVVVLHNGSPVEMPWAAKVKGIIEAFLGGQAIGSVIIDVLFGHINPSGRLPETFPLRLEDNPSFIGFPGNSRTAEYREGVFVGYRWYETKKMNVLFPFGHGLSYTTFAYGNLRLDRTEMTDDQMLTVQVDITNTGDRAGKEVIQLYVSLQGGRVVRPIRELRAFSKVELQPAETKTVTFQLGQRAFAYWNTDIHDWHVENGGYRIEIGRSVQEIELSEMVHVKSARMLQEIFTMNSTLGDLMQNPKSSAILQPMFAGMTAANPEETKQSAVSPEMLAAVADSMTLRNLLSFVPGMTRAGLEQLLVLLNS